MHVPVHIHALVAIWEVAVDAELVVTMALDEVV